MVKNVRPKLTQTEIELIFEAMVKAGYDKEHGSPHWSIYWRFYHLKCGSHTKRRIYTREQVQEYEDREARVKKTLEDLASKDPRFEKFLEKSEGS